MKWRDMAYPGVANPAEFYNTASSNSSFQHFSINMVFHGLQRPEIPADLGEWPCNNRWLPIYVEERDRLRGSFLPNYSKFTLIVLKDKSFYLKASGEAKI
ncbi:hypothetical protein [Geothrix sp. 21YS21S-4]|uniref:hypothetical protein n=1 Tax=Geothrix sp. 21YS21S-4 TaxID=3068889 RepID=UPI0027B8A41E|nr:hypothetical protein [Geothrix sp. 21YS21S-4]